MRVLLVMLGASEFPRRVDLSSPTFEKSHTALRDWLLDHAHGPMITDEDCLDLFNSPRSWPDQEAELADWLTRRTVTEPVPTDLIVHYVGHGGFRDESRDYYLAISTTRAENPFYSSIMVDSLWRTLRSGARRLRRFLIIDACFAAAAARALMAPLQEAVKVKVRGLQDAEGAQAVRDGIVVPDRGTAVLCSSSAHDPASMAGAGGITQFTDGLMQVLRVGSEAANDRLSFAQVHALVKASLSARYKENAVAPELHAPDQRLGLPQDVPIFPNVLVKLAKPRKLIYVSYARLDDESHERWVSTLTDHLRLAVAQRIGSRDDCQIWLDRHSVELGDSFDDEIRDAIARSGYMIVVLSPAYLKSQQCTKELKEFTEQHPRDIEGRIFPVERLPLRDDQVLPEVLAVLQRARFWASDSTGRIRTLGRSSSTRKYLNAIEDLCDAVVAQLIRGHAP